MKAKIPTLYFHLMVFFLSMLAVFSSIPKVLAQYPTGTVKWRPGHYLFLANRVDLEKAASEVAKFGVVRGIQTRYYWEDLEPKKGNYNFSSILADANALQKRGLSLVIQLQYKTFRNQPAKIPAYLKTSEYEGGSYQEARGGWNLRLWNKNVRTRLTALVMAMGKTLNSHPAIALINFPESALAAPASSDPLKANWSYYLTEHAKQLSGYGTILRSAFPNTPSILYFNGGTNHYKYFAPASLKTGVGTGGPDVWVGAYEYNKWSQYAYDLAKQLRGKVPIGHAVQWEDWERVTHGGAFHKNPRIVASQIYSFVQDELHSNFMFWEKRKDYWEQLTALWNLIGKKNDPAGGLRSACPSTFMNCYIKY